MSVTQVAFQFIDLAIQPRKILIGERSNKVQTIEKAMSPTLKKGNLDACCELMIRICNKI